jgi:hypothetical protein
MSHEPTPPATGVGPPPLPMADLVFAVRDPVAIRQAHIRHERQLKSVGLLFGFGALLMFATVILGFFLDDGDSRGPHPLLGMVFIAPFAAGFALLAYGYRTLKPWVKFAGTAVSAIGLLMIPVGTLIHGYILYLIWCAEGQRVLESDYAEIVRATPEVRYRPTVGDRIALALLILIIVGLFSLLFF